MMLHHCSMSLYSGITFGTEWSYLLLINKNYKVISCSPTTSSFSSHSCHHPHQHYIFLALRIIWVQYFSKVLISLSMFSPSAWIAPLKENSLLGLSIVFLDNSDNEKVYTILKLRFSFCEFPHISSITPWPHRNKSFSKCICWINQVHLLYRKMLVKSISKNLTIGMW